MLHSEPGTQM